MAYKKRKIQGGAAELEMTPMIDVVFQLLIYFIVTMKPIDISAHLDVFNPSAPVRRDDEAPPEMIRIMIYSDGLVMNEKAVNMRQLNGYLEQLATLSRRQTIMIHCAANSEHNQLVEVLDACARVGLTNLSIVTMN